MNWDIGKGWSKVPNVKFYVALWPRDPCVIAPGIVRVGNPCAVVVWDNVGGCIQISLLCLGSDCTLGLAHV